MNKSNIEYEVLTDDIFVGENNKLNVLAGTIDEHIQCICIYHQSYVSEYHHPDIQLKDMMRE